MVGFVNEERGFEIIYFAFHKAFDAISYTIYLN